ncbi:MULTISPECIES: TM2 domain-containing protein [unclassified Streptomyces]|uniref:TM2 domain-containing protein n=1 Tax=unclassified Streptomyces TaxID=2593676 RepID=UPI0036561256
MSEQPPQPPSGHPGYPGPGPNDQNPYGAPTPNPYQQQAPPPQPGYGYPQQAGYGYPQQGGYVPPGTYTGDPNAPYGYDPMGRPYSEKSKVVAGVLSLLLGSFGVGRFYIGHVGLGLAQLFTCGGLGIWALIDGIVILAGSDTTDSQGRPLRGG